MWNLQMSLNKLTVKTVLTVLRHTASSIKWNVSLRVLRKGQTWGGRISIRYQSPFLIPFGITSTMMLLRLMILSILQWPFYHENHICAFHKYFGVNKLCHSYIRSFTIYNQMKDWIYYMLSRSQSNFDAVDITAKGHYGAFLSVVLT